jgi:hypothetical protein
MEAEPGNNETLIGLFDLRCDAGRQHIACTQAGCGFACGCYDNWDTDINMGKHEGVPTANYKVGGLERDNAEAREDVPQHRCNKHGDIEIEQQGKTSDFKFEGYRRPSCKLGTHLICCREGRKDVCFCGQRCSIL